jgi:hypothetical protein
MDSHPSGQFIAVVDTVTGECDERRLNRSEGDSEKFYRKPAAQRASVGVEMQSCEMTLVRQQPLARVVAGRSAI